MVGSIFVATSMDELQYTLSTRACKPNRAKVVVVDDEMINQEDYVGGSILLPPTYALCILLDNNDVTGFEVQYLNYLNSNDNVNAYMATIMYAILKGTDIVLYTHTADASMFINQLVKFFSMNGYTFANPMNLFYPALDFSVIGDMNAVVGYLSSYGYDASDIINQINSLFNGGGGYI